MNIETLYPAAFNGTPESLNAFLRTLLIRGTYDTILKKITGYKGMYLYQQSKECWTVKFDNFAGIFGILFVAFHEDIGTFHLYYFPSPNESMLDKFSLAEAIMTQEETYLEKVREFALHPALFRQFHIATLRLHVSVQNQSLWLFYETHIRERVYAKEGVLDPRSEEKVYLIEPEGLDKDLPSFRLLLPLMNFLNTAITRMSLCTPSYFKLFKASQASVAYDTLGHFSDVKDGASAKILIALGYGEGDFVALTERALMGHHAEVVHEAMSLNCFLQKAPWYDISDDIKQLSTHAFAQHKPKFIVVTGFLGSGKTNFLQNYIEYETEKNRFVGIIQNEIGKTGLDGKLLDYSYSLVELDEGCVCCSLAGQLRMGVNTLMQTITPDTIILETTGVANPFNLLSELHELEDIVDFEAIVTVVDGVNALYLYDEFRVFRDQIRAADVILLNKIDQMSESQIDSVKAMLEQNNRCAKIVTTIQCDIHPNLLHNSIIASTSQIASLISEEEKNQATKSTHVQDGISSIKIPLVSFLNREKFRVYLGKLPKNIFRVKGIVTFEEDDNQYVVQYVNGVFELIEQQSEQCTETFLVYIGKNLEKNFVQNPCSM
ncbi:MAG: GTP-binding protein [Sulfurospirillaceae bacterium]|nr:GTP-binding protein [Sulfurospirillaceae bacterium]